VKVEKLLAKSAAEADAGAMPEERLEGYGQMEPTPSDARN
jgi:hypothetical protein